MVSDVLTFLINRKNIIRLINSMEKVNDKLIGQNINVNLGNVRRFSIILYSTITIIEIALVSYNYVMFNDTIFFIPIYYGTIGKVLYLSLVYTIKEFYNGINHQLETIKKYFDEKKFLRKLIDRNGRNVIETDEFGYLHKEILIKRTMASKHKVLPTDGTHKVDVIPYGDNGSFK